MENNPPVLADFADPATAIVLACRRLDARGFVAGVDGNVSARIGDDRVQITPTGVPKRLVTADMLVTIDLDGTVVDGATRPSTEFRLHVEFYRARPDLRAVVHAHPPAATACASSGVDLTIPALPEVVLDVGAVPTAPFAIPGTDALPASIRPFVATHAAILLANHGAVTAGDTVLTALMRMETVEHFADIALRARAAGGLVPLTAADVDALVARRSSYALAGPHPLENA